MVITRSRAFVSLGLLALAALVVGMSRLTPVRMGRQPDGSFLVATGQRIEGGSIAFAGRPIDLALHPREEVFAVLNKSAVFLAAADGVREGTSVSLGEGASAGFHGLIWLPDGTRLYASTDGGHVQAFTYKDGKLERGAKLVVKPAEANGNPVPGGMAITRDGKRLFVAAANRNAIAEIELATLRLVREYPVETLPYEPRLSDDERTLVVSNWGGRLPKPGDRTAKSQDLDIVVDDRGAPASGTVSLIDLSSGATRHVDVGIHPTAIVVDGRRAFVANAMSDSISELDLEAGKVTRTIPLCWGSLRVLGGMPNALALRDTTLFAADGGDNALAEIDLAVGRVRGFRHAGYFPTAVALGRDGKTAIVLNTKGNGSVSRTTRGKAGNAHDFQGTVTVVDLAGDLARETELVARNNRWEINPGQPPAKVYNGAIRNVLYIIKENRTYDEVFGDLPQGNGDPKLCSLGEKIMPNHRKIAREFTLFDNGYVSGTNSADGHAWSTQCLANDYLEHFYVGYSRTYPDDGDCAMSISTGGALWDAALKKGTTVRVWGEFCDDKLATCDPKPKDWFEVWEDRKQGTHKFKFTADTTVASLKPLINREVHYWPLVQSDQFRADVFIREYQEFSRQDRVPELMIMSLPCDHSEGTNPKYPTPRAMMADNDLALGRVVEAVSNSPQWKETCIFVVEDDAQSGPDHVDGHRTVFLAISPYNCRKTVDASFYTQTNMIRSIEIVLGLDPMNKFDSVASPMVACFRDELDLTPYRAVPNNVPLDERNPSGTAMSGADRYWLEKTRSLDWSHLDAPDPYWLSRITWYSIFKGSREYPGRPGEQPGIVRRDVDDDSSLSPAPAFYSR
ncbi:MAG TPA: bifunctional YncE family protein/alkaline phosphatase family protein [Isosphaeraceae bacterium]|nr:bifunctional YncE family protein/alkaline phosphatase family protein [Isosphaeraceae bacterium]